MSAFYAIATAATTVTVALLILIARLILNRRNEAAIKQWKELLGAIQHIVSIIAVVLGGFWVYTEFIMYRTGEWNAELKVKHRVLPHPSSDKVILVADVYFKNVGRIPFQPNEKGLMLYVGEVRVTGDDPNGALPLPGSVTSCLARVALGEEFTLEPGAEFHESAAVVVPKDKTISVLAKLNSLDDQIVVRSSLPEE